MRKRLLQWLAPPSRANPGETLRWVRRVSVLASVFALLIAAQLALQGANEVMIWVIVASALLGATSWVTLRPAIRRADQRGPLTAEEFTRGVRRGDRAVLVMAALYCITFPIIGYLLEGLGGAIFFFVMGTVSGGLGIWMNRRFRRREEKS